MELTGIQVFLRKIIARVSRKIILFKERRLLQILFASISEMRYNIINRDPNAKIQIVLNQPVRG